MHLLQAPWEECWAKVSFHKNLAAGRPGGPIHRIPSGCCGSHLPATGANLAFYSETLGTTGLQEEPGKGQEEYGMCPSQCPARRAQWDSDLADSIEQGCLLAEMKERGAG